MKLTHIVAGTALLLSGFTAGSLAIGLSASATSNSITFYACSNKTTGILSATSTKAPTCANTATLVSWNSVGPQGAPGPTGPMGPQANSSCLLGSPYPNLGGCELSGINLDDFSIRHANFGNADLSGASLLGADLSLTNFKNANLSGANLTGANLTGANLTGANLTNAQLSGATCPNGIVHGQSGANC